MKTYCFILLIIQCSIILINCLTPWPQREHDAQFSNRANPNTMIPSGRLCSSSIFTSSRESISSQFLAPTEDMILYGQLLYNSTTLEKIAKLNHEIRFVNSDGTIGYFVVHSSRLIALELKTEKIVWKKDYKIKDKNIGVVQINSYNSISNAIEAQTFSDILHIDAIDGSLLWKTSSDTSYPYVFDFVGANPQNGNPIYNFYNGLISEYTSSTPRRKNYFAEYNASNGKQVWVTDHIEGYSGETIISDSGELLIQGSKFIGAISLKDGSLLWKKKLTKFEVVAGFALLQKNSTSSLVVCLFDSNIIIINPTDGNIIARTPKDWKEQYFVDIIAIQNTIIITQDGSRFYPITNSYGLFLVDLSDFDFSDITQIYDEKIRNVIVRTDGTLFGTDYRNDGITIRKISTCG
eukprot:TRINITY_DN5679_c0_g1_i1.p1 TRINITY_DN5679_c0_g1~~TRINITY_DN5679_c0_g1_i1.p1  ORF type:complete len:407 (-),score=22.09 TRINITY_DN5679_c0_g1_i1:157-1377(-)